MIGGNPVVLTTSMTALCQFAVIRKCEPNGRGRNTGYPVPPAQIPACAANALGSSLEYERQSGNKDEDVIIVLWGKSEQ